MPLVLTREPSRYKLMELCAESTLTSTWRILALPRLTCVEKTEYVTDVALPTVIVPHI